MQAEQQTTNTIKKSVSKKGKSSKKDETVEQVNTQVEQVIEKVVQDNTPVEQVVEQVVQVEPQNEVSTETTFQPLRHGACQSRTR